MSAVSNSRPATGDPMCFCRFQVDPPGSGDHTMMMPADRRIQIADRGLRARNHDLQAFPRAYKALSERNWLRLGGTGTGTARPGAWARDRVRVRLVEAAPGPTLLGRSQGVADTVTGEPVRSSMCPPP
jgi:hypothetical protein